MRRALLERGLVLAAMASMACTAPGRASPLQRSASEARWQEGAGPLAGSQLWVLEGDPRAAGLFTLRARLPPGFRLPRHTHPADERVTVLEGEVAVRLLDASENKEARERRFEAGGFYVTPAGLPHTLSTQSGAVLQLTGMGPWRVDLVSAD
jgi:quercetin dioxygenase-like cupin family protein